MTVQQKFAKRHFLKTSLSLKSQLHNINYSMYNYLQSRHTSRRRSKYS